MTYSTTSPLTRTVCQKIGFIFDIHFVKTAQHGEKIYVAGTVGKPHEFEALHRACAEHGYIYRAQHWVNGRLEWYSPA